MGGEICERALCCLWAIACAAAAASPPERMRPYGMWWPPPPPPAKPDAECPYDVAHCRRLGGAQWDSVAPTFLSFAVSPYADSIAAHALLDEKATMWCQATAPTSSPTPQSVKAAGFSNSSSDAAVPIRVMVTGLVDTGSLFHLCCVAEDANGNLSPFVRMLPVSLDHRNHYRHLDGLPPG